MVIMHGKSPLDEPPAGDALADGTRAMIASSEAPAYEVIGGDAASGLVLLCDHACNSVPDDLAALGLPAGEFTRHIAFDIGAAALTRGLAEHFGAPAVLSRFSRLVIDPNRGLDDPTLIMRLSDGAVVPGNAGVDVAERARRVERFYAPYDAAIGATIEAVLATGRVPAVFSVHSFTPFWRGVARPWQAAVLWDADPRFAKPLIAGLAAQPGLLVGDNEPYHGALKGDTLYRHATRRGLAHALVEVRQDLIADEAGVAEWVERLARVLASMNLAASPFARVQHGSLTGPVEPLG